MNERVLKLYHSLPFSARSVVASARGLHLRRWRYGSETTQLVKEALEREQWSPQQWKVWQENRLGFVLHRAGTHVPYYRRMWAKRRTKGDLVSWDYLENWPILEKEDLRAQPLAFVAEDCNPRRMFHEHTSGTSGTVLSLWWSKRTVREWYALFEARWRKWYGVSKDDRWAILGGQLVIPFSQKRPPFWVWNAAMRQLYMSSYHLAPVLVPDYLDALVHYRIKYLWGYTSSLYSLALEALRLNRSDIRMMVAITNAEPLFDYQREAIAEAFHCPVRETYGMAEIVAAASECDAGNLHLWPEVGILEAMEGAEHVSQGNPGDLICTGLFNADMPLIRYRVGDRAALQSDGSPCSCGRSLPRLQSVEGRTDDTLYTSDGRRIGRLDPVFKNKLPIREAQIVQEAIDRIRVRFVPGSEYTAAAGALLVERLQSHLGPVNVLLEPVDAIPRTANGKFRAVVCELPMSQRRHFNTRRD